MLTSTGYVAFLLRLWLAGDGDQPQWRASLEDPRTGQVQGFANLDEMVEFLKALERMNSGKTEEAI